MMRALALIAFLLASRSAAADADADRSAAADRLARSGQSALDAVLGPGRASLRVEVDGERSEITTETEILSPIERASGAGKAAQRVLELPGYAKDRPSEPPKEPSASSPPLYQKDRELSRRDAGFQVRAVRAVVVMDAALPDAAVREATQLLPQVLRLDAARGDVLTFLRAPVKPAWKSAFSSPSDLRSAAYALGGAASLVLCAMILGACLLGAGRAAGRAPASRTEPAHFLPGEPLPELSSAAVGLLETGRGEAPPLLGRRFDFLIGRDPGLISRALEPESAQELAVFFAHLSESIPELASRLFARLPAPAQTAVSEALLKITAADPARLNAFEDRLRAAVENGVLGPRSLGRILSRVSGAVRSDLLSLLAARDPRSAEEVERHVFAFEDLAGLETSALRPLAAAVPAETWGAALRGAPPGLAERVLSSLPDAARSAARAAAATPHPRDEVAEARAKVLDALAARAEKSGLGLGGAELGGGLV